MSAMKTIVIDGHNLIPKLPGIHLSDMDDESELLGIIQDYCRLARRNAELFFDGAPTADPARRKSGLVRPHFVKKGRTADDSIVDWLRKSGRNARNVQVVSSDRRVQAEARSLGAEVISSEGFAEEVKRVLSSPAATQEMKEKKLSEHEVEDWLRVFQRKEED